MSLNDIMNGINVIKNTDVDYLEKQIYKDEYHMKLLPYSFYKKIPLNDLMLFAYKKAIYSYFTEELIQWIFDNVYLTNAIEIGSGNGSLCRFLGIRGTDSKIQDSPEVKRYYQLARQPTIKYPYYVEKIDAISAIQKYHPSTVIASWVTQKYNENKPGLGGSIYGVDEKYIIDNVDRYIFIGNEKTHYTKEILDFKHRTIKEKWLVSRSSNQECNLIYIWDKNDL